jgi:phosphomannomutase
MNESIFRAYDIRGIVDVTLSEDDVYNIGRAFATYLHDNDLGKNIDVAMDSRLSSPMLKEGLISGLLEGGMHVRDLDIVPTPTLYFTSYHKDVDAGIMITGSHNPINYNGLKFVLKQKPFYGDDLLKLRDICKAGKYCSGQGKLKLEDLRFSYVNEVVKHARVGEKKLKAVWDPANGAVASILNDLTTSLPWSHVLINESLDGNFPAHHPDPHVYENLLQLIEVVKYEDADIGIAFDGDGDRLAVVDKFGNVLSGEKLLTIFAQDLLTRHNGASIICDVKTSDTIIAKIKSLGGNPLLWKTGHSNIKVKMKEIGCLLAGEMSGHIFFGEDYFGFDDAVLGAIKLLSILSNSDKSLTDFYNDFAQNYESLETKVEVNDEEKFAIIAAIKAELKARQIEFCDIDGVRVSNEDGWWLIRASNTEPCLTVRIEATDAEAFAKSREIVCALLKVEF